MSQLFVDIKGLGILTLGIAYLSLLLEIDGYRVDTIGFLCFTNEAGIPVYGSEVEQVKLGCVAAAGIDYVQLGRQTGAIAAKVLKGEAACQDIPFETISEYGIYINSAALAEMGIALPADVAAKAIESTEA